jgi:predicted branched-subunit amino acid permease
VRALQGQAIVDASFAMASHGDGTFDPGILIGATVPQFCGWVAGTIMGVLGGGLLAHPTQLGIDAIFPAFYLALLAAEFKNHRDHPSRRRVLATIVGATAITIALMSFAPPGVPVICASLAALIGVRSR